jgi:hypothetical protein
MSPPTSRWRVVRLDDNGQLYVVEDGLDEGRARATAHRFELRAHKQIYWAEPSEPGTTAT